MFYTLWPITELLDKIAVPPVPSYKSNKKNVCAKIILTSFTCESKLRNCYKFKEIAEEYLFPDKLLK